MQSSLVKSLTNKKQKSLKRWFVFSVISLVITIICLALFSLPLWRRYLAAQSLYQEFKEVDLQFAQIDTDQNNFVLEQQGVEKELAAFQKQKNKRIENKRISYLNDLLSCVPQGIDIETVTQVEKNKLLVRVKGLGANSTEKMLTQIKKFSWAKNVSLKTVNFVQESNLKAITFSVEIVL
ncbi:MAG: hypothetical protein UR26_C0002G0197 [candidate division TM6 bacterium GW2011_GWF2_32_72]|nr:MAG: hypothetical protein UR26_C0002G0197 [candidate division TM6 bacterium GW2011_GWF2_32_72]